MDTLAEEKHMFQRAACNLVAQSMREAHSSLMMEYEIFIYLFIYLTNNMKTYVISGLFFISYPLYADPTSFHAWGIQDLKAIKRGRKETANGMILRHYSAYSEIEVVFRPTQLKEECDKLF